MVNESAFQKLCDLVSQLALQTNKVALGLQGLSVDQELKDIARAAQVLGGSPAK